MKRVETRILPQVSPGTWRSLTIFRYGTPNARPKAYLQAGLHADEAPGYPVLHRLVEKLDVAAEQGNIIGEVVDY